uniref:Uncharacterized protein n=1 Tax=Lotus japonicus TaxID=34305 RepID=I3SLV4_LOTJA|nr:unknown [Lotus japonicus]
MAGNSASNNGNQDVVLNVNAEAPKKREVIKETEDCVPLLKKFVAELVGTYFLVFAGCAAIIVNLSNDKVVTLPGIAMVWGLAVMVLVLSIGHISGAHLNPAVTLTHATTKRFSFKQVPAYLLAQFVGAILASGTLRLIFTGKENHFPGTLASGSELQAFVFEFISTFHLMFAISGVSTDNRAIGEMAGLAIGATILLNVIIAGPITGASMNPARSLGPAIVHS